MVQPPLYIASVPVFRRYLGRLALLVGAAEQHASRTATAEADLMAARLAPDMLPFDKQVEIAANFALRACFPLTGRPVPPFGDFPASFAGLRARIVHVTGLIEALDAAEFAAPAEQLQDTAGEARLSLPAEEFLLQYAVPNFFFHLSMAYAILRQRGVPVGKGAFDGYHVYPSPR